MARSLEEIVEPLKNRKAWRKAERHEHILKQYYPYSAEAVEEIVKKICDFLNRKFTAGEYGYIEQDMGTKAYRTISEYRQSGEEAEEKNWLNEFFAILEKRIDDFKRHKPNLTRVAIKNTPLPYTAKISDYFSLFFDTADNLSKMDSEPVQETLVSLLKECYKDSSSSYKTLSKVVSEKYKGIERFYSVGLGQLVFETLKKNVHSRSSEDSLKIFFDSLSLNYDILKDLDKDITKILIDDCCTLSEYCTNNMTNININTDGLIEFYRREKSFLNSFKKSVLKSILHALKDPFGRQEKFRQIIKFKPTIEILDKKEFYLPFYSFESLRSVHNLLEDCPFEKLKDVIWEYFSDFKIHERVFSTKLKLTSELNQFCEVYGKNYDFFKRYKDHAETKPELTEFILGLARNLFNVGERKIDEKVQRFMEVLDIHYESIINGVKNDGGKELYSSQDIVNFLECERKKESCDFGHIKKVFDYIAEKQCDKFEDILECAKLSFQRYGILENYDVIKKLGSGAFKRAYLAKNRATDKQEAIKILDKNKLGEYLQQKVGWTDAELLKHEFRQEELKKLNNQNISRIEHIGFYSGRCFIIEEYFKKTLEDVLKEKKKFSLSETIDYIMQIATALKAAHSLKRPLSHGDLNLANIGIMDGVIKVTDFGFASSIRYDPEIRKINVGAISSRAPELYKNLTPTAQSDVWSIGVLMYRMLSGNFPFYYGTYTDSKQREECEKNVYKDICDKLSGSKKICEAPNIPEEIKDSPLEIQDILNKCIVFDPKQRFQDTGKLYKVLKSINPTRYEIDLKRREFTTKEWMGDLESERRVIAARSRGVPLPMTEFWVLSVPLKYFNSKEDDVIRHNMGREYHPELKKFGLEHLGLSFFIEEVILPDLDGVKPKDPTYNFGKIGRFKINDVKVEGDRIIISSHAYPEIDSSHSPSLKP